MAMVSIGESKWYILRQLALRDGTAPWDDVRGHKRRDEEILQELVAARLVRWTKGVVSLTDAGWKAQQLGEIEV